MALLFHIIVALGGLVASGLAYLSPSQNKLRLSYALVALTFTSGAYLVLSTHSNMLSACGTGLAYLGIVSIGIFSARTKLAHSLVRSDE